MKSKFVTALFMLLAGAGVVHAQSGYVAGLDPSQRPVQAPRVSEQPMSAEELAHALQGIDKPYPGNVEQIAATGHWFVPLRRPGMTGPYDLRGWHVDHKAKQAASPASSAQK